MNEECLVSEIRVTEEEQLNSREVRKVNDDTDADDNNNNNHTEQLHYFSDFGGWLIIYLEYVMHLFHGSNKQMVFVPVTPDILLLAFAVIFATTSVTRKGIMFF